MNHEYDYPEDDVPVFPERDERGDDSLPTYDELAAQHGPNSRFGRWRKWIEKRAAERYADLTPEDLERRRARGWGEGLQDSEPVSESSSTSLPASSALESQEQILPAHVHGPPLHVQTDFSASFQPASPPGLDSDPSLLAELIPETIFPSHLKLCQFGSRFLPHATAPIRCLLPILNDQVLLIGHDNGLSVLDMYPHEWTETGLVKKGPADAEVRHIWEGEAVFQMSILEAESTGQGTPQGVVLALVGPDIDSPKDQDSIRTLRMYNLASIVSLAKWAIGQKGNRPLNLRYTPGRLNHPKRHRPQGSITKGLRNLVIDAPLAQPQAEPDPVTEPHASYSQVADSPVYTKPLPPRPSDSPIDAGSPSSWEMVDELPLMWAAHYTPLASPGSRLHNTSVLFFDHYRNENQRSRGGSLLAVATKSNIFLYEAPKGERAFHLIKEFYTPLTSRSIAFVHQAVTDPMSRSASDAAVRSGSRVNSRHSRVISLNVSAQRYSNQLSLFVIFEKKAGIIRIADSAVSEVELFEEANGAQQFLAPPGASSMGRKSRASWDGRGFVKEPKGVWVPPVKFDLPIEANHSLSASMCVLTRGKQSHIMPHPLPPSIPMTIPYRVLRWSVRPTHVSCRVCTPSQRRHGQSPFLQVVAFGEDGIEVRELPLSSLTERKGKRRDDEPVRAMADVSGSTGFLCSGGFWSDTHPSWLGRSVSMESQDSATSLDDWSEEEVADRLRARQGVYGWVRKGQDDWRVFWVGGSSREHEGDESDI
ncbi:uncharacterized protein LAESUDRAFT_655698 [Laetiporus sulphureus 93-53]|uniref:Uncharacterized protein n=1 Tax=Laetiporus sulphureus 93-53 TaxID=1314785 RepID=A0A165DT32_9APHY|nr:uncharacterized protein LAESUDRAFT_655698 [Laetiporus sulphureus 93-53]KZT05574.1 hypothetical protein LAESUDRAFT_655698 [Laetiporus sulphureus 93-53]